MKQFIGLILLLASVSFAGTSWAEVQNEGKIYLRPIIGIGYTFVSNDVSETYESNIARDITRTNISGGFGLQLLTDVNSRLRAGVEAGFQHYINETTDGDGHPLAPKNEYCYHSINTLALLEFDLGKRFFVQAGSGLATSIMPNNKYTGATPYFMIASGVNFQVSKTTAIPVSVRLTTLDSGKGEFGEGSGFGSVFPITLVTGVTLTY